LYGKGGEGEEEFTIKAKGKWIQSFNSIQ
jgi:hypothetical protein